MKREHLILLAIVAVGAFLRLYKLDGEYVHALDSYRILSDAIRIISFDAPKYVSAWPGRSIAIIPFLLIKNSAFSSQIGIALYGIAIIPLSYFFSSKCLKLSSNACLVFSAFVAINPTLVVMSKVVIWDIIILFFILFALIITKKMEEKRSFSFSIFFSFLVFFICFMKPTNLIFAVIIFLYLLLVRKIVFIDSKRIKFNLRCNMDVLFSLSVFLFLFGFNMIFHPSLASGIASGGGFYRGLDYIGNIKATTRLMTVPLNTPPTNMYFVGTEATTPLLTFLGIFQAITFILGVKKGLETHEKETILLLGIALAYVFVFLGYSGWVGRQLLPSLLIVLLFLAIGLEEIYLVLKERRTIKKYLFSCVAIILLVSIAFSAHTSFSQAFTWGSDESKIRNFIAIDSFDMNWIEDGSEDVGLIVTGYGAWCEYVLGKERAEKDVVNFFYLDNKSGNEDSLINTIQTVLDKGDKVWFLSGWVDGYDYANMKRYADAISNNFDMINIYEGDKKFVNKDGSIDSSFIVYELKIREGQK